MSTRYAAVAMLALLASASEAQQRECTPTQRMREECPTPARQQVPAPKASVPAPSVAAVNSDSQPAGPKPAADSTEYKPSGLSTRRLSLLAKDDRFTTSEACLSALKAGTARFYHPTYFKPVRLGSGERTLELEHDACVRMQIVGAVAWVPQARGTKLDFNGTTPVRRTDCGNKVYAVVYPTVPVVETKQPPEDVVVPPPTLLFRPDEYTVKYNEGTNLRWRPTNAGECVANDGWSGYKNPSGGSEPTGRLKTSRTYALTCIGNGEVTQFATVNVLGRPNWLSRNWKWALPVGVAVAYGTCEAFSRSFGHEPWKTKCLGHRNTTNVNQIQDLETAVRASIR